MSGPADPVVRLGDPCEPFSWSWEGPLSAFLADNAETIGPEEAETIRRTIARGFEYDGGGGAEPEWSLWGLLPIARTPGPLVPLSCPTCQRVPDVLRLKIAPGGHAIVQGASGRALACSADGGWSAP